MNHFNLLYTMKNLKTYIMVFLTTFFWGLTYHLSKYTLQYIEPTQIALFRFIFGLLFLLLYLFIFFYNNNLYNLFILIKKSLSYKRYIIILSFIGILIFNYSFYKGIEFSNPATGAIIFSSNPAITTLIIRIWKKEPQPLLRILGIVIAFIGVFLTSYDILLNSSNLYKEKSIVGFILILISSFAWAIYGIVGFEFLKKHKNIFNETELTTVNILWGTFLLLIASMIETNFHPINNNIFRMDVFLILLFMGIFSTGLAYIWWYNGVKKIGPVKTAIFMNVVPIMAIIIEFILYQNITWNQIIGGFCVISGVIFTIYK